MSHASLEDLVSYFAGDHAGEDTLESHLFECETCAALATRVAAVTETIRGMIPPVIDRATLASLRARGLRLRDNRVQAGTPNDAVFDDDIDLLIHHLEGIDLTSATDVSVRVSVEQTGDVLAEFPSAAFDADAGEVLIACQRHFAALPPDTVMDVRVRRANGEDTTRFVIRHRFAFGSSSR